MKKKFLKLVAVFACFVMVLSMTVFAADSPSTTGNSDTVDTAVTQDTVNKATTAVKVEDAKVTSASGAELTVKYSTSSDVITTEVVKYAVEKVQNIVKELASANPTTTEKLGTINTKELKSNEKIVVAAAVDVTIPDIKPEDIPEGGIAVPVAVEGIKAGDKVAVLHQKADTTWESLPIENVADGVITAKFTSFSPVVVVRVETVNDTAPVSPSTGYNMPVVVIFALVAALAGTVFCARRRVAR